MYAKYEVALHHKLIAKKLQDLEQRKIKRLMVFMPPRHGKSFLISQMFPAWYLGRNPEHQVIFTTYNQEIASDFGRKVRNMMAEPIFQSVFPEVQISDDSSSNKRFHTNKGGVYYSVGAGGPLTSRGGDLILIDDIHKSKEEVDSIVVRKTIHDWFGSTLYTRLMPNAVMVLVQTRWREDDLPGRLLEEQGSEWDILNLPALSDTHEALWPTRFPVDTLLNIKKTIGSREFEALYQQRPTAQEGNIIKRPWLKFYDTHPEIRSFDQVIQSWDLTFTGKSTSDYVVGQVWGAKGPDRYLLDQERGQYGMTETLQAIQMMTKKWPHSSIKVIEAKANGPAVEDVLRRTMQGIVLWEPQGDKVARCNAIAPIFESGHVYLPNASKYFWVQDAIEEICTFPNGAHDDVVDSMTMALLRLNEHGKAGGLRVIFR